ncbi:enoyl-CoA hydratase-related protein [Geomicrobium sp. JCM 19039]|uniref:enoyl-CoA hydratase-related protein n=1 Tax=Geomicrobium sp. JCM 19039 TaxID=1460636 RepID=UPI00045F19AF|nr:enoyl-CoA hydratase-related protein [Geomicrobium sp. JCM 19039]GAK11262.1 methylglutaconyl-CoA hydratase [Geomicrobium sp. JCM 19039]
MNVTLVEWSVNSEGIALIELQREKQAHSLSKDVLLGLSDIVESLKAEQDVRAVVLTSTGDKVFCAGADLKERAGMSESEVLQAVRRIQSVIHEISEIPQPTIAALTGSALGGGLELALAADIRIGADEGKYGLPETSLAIIPGAGGTQRLSRLLGSGKAKQLIFTGELISGVEAERIGLLEMTTAVENVRQHAFELAEKIAKNGPLALRQAKRAVDLGQEVDLLTGLQIERVCYEHTVPTADRREGLLAFKEKRKPQYIGK